MVIVRILLGLINAILHLFVASFLLLVSAAASGLLAIAVVIVVVLLLTGSLGFGISRRRRK